jgi:hypothetical protein
VQSTRSGANRNTCPETVPHQSDEATVPIAEKVQADGGEIGAKKSSMFDF